MAKYDVTYSCGHTGTIELYGPGAERERKIAWIERNQTCSDCYRGAKQANPDAPAIYVRVIPGHDPAIWRAEIARQQSKIARAEGDLARLADDEARDNAQRSAGIYWGHKDYKPTKGSMERNTDIARGKREVAAAKASLASAANQAAKAATPAKLEIVVLNSYALKDHLKARGYRYASDTGIGNSSGGIHALSLSGGKPGWTKITASADHAGAELAWLKSLAPASKIETLDYAHNILASLFAGRPDLVGVAL